MRKFLLEYLYDYLRVYSLTTLSHLLNYLTTQTGLSTADVTPFLQVVLDNLGVFSPNTSLTTFTELKSFVQTRNMTGEQLISMIKLVAADISADKRTVFIVALYNRTLINADLSTYSSSVTLLQKFLDTELVNIKDLQVRALLQTEAALSLNKFNAIIASLNTSLVELNRILGG